MRNRSAVITTLVLFTGWIAGCGNVESNPDPDAANDADTTDAEEIDAELPIDARELDGFACTAGEMLSCTGNAGTRCGANGTTIEDVTCPAGCHATEVRCNRIASSNGLDTYLDMAGAEPDANLGTSATINTDDGNVIVDGGAVVIRSELITSTTPNIRVLVVKSLTTGAVTVRGTHALAIVSAGDITIGGHFSVSAVSHDDTSGPGASDAGGCLGGNYVVDGTAFSGPGGGGFGSPGGRGGTATNTSNGDSATGPSGGTIVGTATLIPLRGGCHSGTMFAGFRGGGGGAVQMVSSTRIVVNGVISANGSSYGAGGSGGGILLEAPAVTLSGNVVANGGAGAGGATGSASLGEDGRLDATPARGGTPPDVNYGMGGNGAAGATGATSGANKSYNGSIVFAGHGGGGVGRIRVNARPGMLTQTAIVSPTASVGSIGVR